MEKQKQSTNIIVRDIKCKIRRVLSEEEKIQVT
jgi:hypothetical protein